MKEQDFSAFFRKDGDTVMTHLDVPKISRECLDKMLELENRWVTLHVENLKALFTALDTHDEEKFANAVNDINERIKELRDKNVNEATRYVADITSDIFITGYIEGGYNEVANYNKTIRGLIKDEKLADAGGNLTKLTNITEEAFKHSYAETFKDKALNFYTTSNKS